MDIDRLDGVRAKIIRAREHLDLFESEVAIYAAVHPYSIVRRFEDHIPEKSGRPGLTWRASVDGPPPPRLSVIAGDCLHNLRSALDHLAWALVLVNGGTPSERDPSTQFPIVVTPTTKNGHAKKVTIRAQIGGPSEPAMTLVKALQPYKRGKSAVLHPLAVLSRLSNADKHRTLVVVALDLGKVVIRFPQTETTGTAIRLDVINGTLVFWILQEHPDFNREVDVHTDFAPSITFLDARGMGDQPSVPAVELLTQLFEFMRDNVVQRFARAYFGSPLTFR